MSDSAPAPASAPAPLPKPRSRRWPVAIGLLLLAGALAGSVAWLGTTDAGLRALVTLASRFAPITIEAGGVHGALAREFGFERLHIVVGGTEIDLDGLRARLRRVGAQPPRLEFESLSARRVAVKLTPSGEPSTGAPESIASPVAVSAGRLAVGELTVQIGSTQLAARALDAELALGPDGYRIDAGRFEYAGQPVTLQGRLGGRKPFAVDLSGSIEAAVRDQHVQLRWRADGSLVDLGISAEVSGGGAQGKVSARIAVFDSPLLKSLRADLRPDASATGVEGTVRAINRAPGTLDAHRVPVREAQAEIVVTPKELRANAVSIALSRGSVRGSVLARLGAEPDWQAALQLGGVDPAAIHAKARPLLIDGSAKLRQKGGTTAVQAELRNRGDKVVHANVDLRLNARRVDIARAELSLGQGRLATTGTVGLTGGQQIRLEGTVEHFDPGLLVKGVDAIVSGDFGVDAQLAPQPRGSVRFALRDSRAFGRPVTGHGRLNLDAAQQLDVDVELGVRSARLSARGGLGAAGRSLAVALDAPALDELLPALHGAVTAEVTASGAWAAPAVDARISAKGLRAGDQVVQQAQVSASYGGGADGRIALRAEVSNHTLRDRAALSLHNATLAIDGKLSAHTISFHGRTANARDLALAANGGWLANEWRGVLREASIGGPLDLRLREPSTLAVSAGRIEFGPAALAAVGAHFDAVRLTAGADGLHSSGSFGGLRPQDLAARFGAIDAATASAGKGREPLALQGRWEIGLGAQADGSLLIERSGGDLYAGRTAEGALRIRELRLEATLRANQLAARAVAASERGGAAHVDLSALVEHDNAAGWRLAQRRPWQLAADVNVPSLARINALLGELLGTDMRIDGHLEAQLAIGGTPGDVQTKGTLAGDGLRLAWIEQGMRLEDGRLRARLDGDQLWLDELRFAGPPRVRPKDVRVAGKVDFKQEGTLTASGHLRLRDADGTIKITAQRLPLLQRPDRWVVASGSASIEASLERAQFNGNFTADAGYLEAVPSGLPSLSSDVVVVQPGADTAQRAPRYAFAFDVGVNLGQLFYVKGAGLDARVEGLVRLRNPGRGAVTATGTIEAKEGRYDGFGQRLAIKRARINFQGSPENPALDVLAVREGLPVEVGVTVTRTVNNPLVRLHSDPPMADPEIMSWLMFGHAGEQTRADNLALLQAAAGAMAGGEKGVAGKFAESLGIDDISLRSGDYRSAGSLLPQSSVAGDLRGDRTNTTSANSEILALSKRVSDKLTVSYEQALAGTESVVQLIYRVSHRMYIVVRAGTETAFDLVYSWTFD